MENIVFDMGNVLLRYDPAAMLSRYTQAPDDIGLCIKTVFESEEWRLCDRGDGYRSELLPCRIAMLPEHLRGICEDLLYRDDLELSFMPEIAGMYDLISALKKNGYGIYLLSNVGLCFPQFSKKVRIFALFDGLFASSEYHMLKPDKEIFDKFLEVFSLKAEDCIFIDDTPANCAGSRLSGMRAVCFNGGTESVSVLKERLAAEGIVTE